MVDGSGVYKCVAGDKVGVEVRKESFILRIF